ncbi:hypothetical protein CHL67_11200 [Prosthecochloris sp. GSB1]|uniref:DinB family protein n=1 Tax=Prosthecochloris sp. GSB1 TaxID=281093 RepID=UPI000B8CE598|nr:DinB family protein [Prosthecochloris sp. GSB1]ASQ91411.1 hypothetical protein CHL67_11200 [Prosthecochloris sp. GSB1]
MNWKELLEKEAESSYKGAEVLFGLVDDSMLDWKPQTGGNWMTTGQLLRHVADACGESFRGFTTGVWGPAEGPDPASLPIEETLPSAETLPSVESVGEAGALLAEDRKLVFDLLASIGDEELGGKEAPAPWDPTPMLLGHRLLQMIDHLKIHKAQLYYYLKLQDKPVHTGHLWVM